MASDGKEPSKPTMRFEEWKSLLRKDCELQGKTSAFNALGDYVLEMLWKIGLSPTVEALAEGTSEPDDAAAESQLMAPTAIPTLDISKWSTPSKKNETQ